LASAIQEQSNSEIVQVLVEISSSRSSWTQERWNCKGVYGEKKKIPKNTAKSCQQQQTHFTGVTHHFL